MAKPRSFRSGFCGSWLPSNHVSHRSCRRGYLDEKSSTWISCVCACHATEVTTTEPATAPPKRVLSARAAPGVVIVVADPITATVLAGLLEQAYTGGALTVAARPLWAWDVAAIRRAATEAARMDEAPHAAPRVDVGFTPAPHLALLDGGGQP